MKLKWNRGKDFGFCDLEDFERRRTQKWFKVKLKCLCFFSCYGYQVSLVPLLTTCTNFTRRNDGYPLACCTCTCRLICNCTLQYSYGSYVFLGIEQFIGNCVCSKSKDTGQTIF